MPWTINLCFPSRFTFNMLTNIYPETHVLVVKVPANKATISTTVYMLKVKASIVCKSFGIGNKHSISGKNLGDYSCILSKDLLQRIIVMLKSFSIVQMVYSIEY